MKHQIWSRQQSCALCTLWPTRHLWSLWEPSECRWGSLKVMKCRDEESEEWVKSIKTTWLLMCSFRFLLHILLSWGPAPCHTAAAWSCLRGDLHHPAVSRPLTLPACSGLLCLPGVQTLSVDTPVQRVRWRWDTETKCSVWASLTLLLFSWLAAPTPQTTGGAPSLWTARGRPAPTPRSGGLMCRPLPSWTLRQAVQVWRRWEHPHTPGMAVFFYMFDKPVCVLSQMYFYCWVEICTDDMDCAQRCAIICECIIVCLPQTVGVCVKLKLSFFS